MTSDIFDEIFRNTLFGTSVFKDETKLFREYIPEQLPRREKELERISRDFRPIFKDKVNFPVNIALSGKSGVGKTVLAKYFCERLVDLSKSLNKKIEYQYCNCYTYRSKSAILYHLLSKLYDATSRGFEPENLLLDLHNRLKRDSKKLLLILDEIHVLNTDEILFFLQFTEPNIYYILISRDYFFKKILNVNLSGRINDHIKLEGYSKDDLIQILNSRVEAFKQGVINREIIEMIADVASNTQNARHAIEILYHAGKIADCSKNDKNIITAEMVREAKNYIFPETSSKILKTLKKNELFAILALARCLLIEDCPDVSIKEAYSYFKIVCEEFGMKPKTQNMFTKSIKQLIDLGLIIQLYNQSKIIHKKPLKITLHDVPAQILEQQLIKLLKTKKNSK